MDCYKVDEQEKEDVSEITVVELSFPDGKKTRSLHCLELKGDISRSGRLCIQILNNIVTQIQSQVLI